MRAYIINLDSAPERWASVTKAFSGTQFPIVRVAGIDGYALKYPIKEYAEGLYRWFHGRPTSPGHVGCYLSHVQAMKEFLATDEKYALIAEDDLTLETDFEAVIDSAMKFADHWNVLRLTGLGRGKPGVIAPLKGRYQICVGFARMKGTGAYIIDRKGAAAWSTGLLPMRLPIDHALDREWFFGMKAAYVLPFPASQTESGFRSSIQVGKSLKLPSWRRYLATYPYQAGNELTRWMSRSWQYLIFSAAVKRSR